MATLDERVAFLQGRVDEQSLRLTGIREAIISLEERMDRRFEAADRRFDAVDRRFESIEQRLAALDQRFLWLVGIQLTTLATVVAALLAR